MAKILVVDDQAGMRRSLAILLKREGFHIAEAENGARAMELLERESFDLVITDLKMSHGSGLDVLRHVKEKNLMADVIIMTAYGTVDTAVEAMKIGAYDYIAKPFNHEEILHRVRKSVSHGEINREQQILSKGLASGIIGESRAITEMVSLINKIAIVDIPVLITGETGTGKNLVARAIHSLSSRSNKPFVSLNCAAVPEHLLESELFGHSKGAFTGAILERKGLFEEAEGGTLFLDEIGNMPFTMQAKLLDVLQDRVIRKVGENKTREVNVRIIAATNTDLEQAIRENRFREDLYYRVNVTHIHIPPLRERPEDIPLLAQHFIERCRTEFKNPDLRLSTEVMDFLYEYDYSGNVRELCNIVSSAAAIASGPEIAMEDLCLTFTRSMFDLTPRGCSELGVLSESERDLIIRSIRKNPNLTKACEELGISRTTLWRKMKKYRIE
ncbi:MAG: sigma-54 dependent transcriptional regulator [Nitrospirota bacterium]|jgi:two-component system response regulator HydG